MATDEPGIDNRAARMHEAVRAFVDVKFDYQHLADDIQALQEQVHHADPKKSLLAAVLAVKLSHEMLGQRLLQMAITVASKGL